jgi:hypothetical protein
MDMEFDPTEIIRRWLRRHWYEIVIFVAFTIFLLSKLGMPGDVMAAWAQALLSAGAIYASAWITFTANRLERQAVIEQKQKEKLEEMVSQLELIRIADEHNRLAFSSVVSAARHFSKSHMWSYFPQAARAAPTAMLATASTISISEMHTDIRQLASAVITFAHYVGDVKQNFLEGDGNITHVKELADVYEDGAKKLDIQEQIRAAVSRAQSKLTNKNTQ